MNIASEKLASIFILIGLSLTSGILSCVAVKCLVLKLGPSSKFKRAMSLLNCFSGGVFFATSVLDLLPEARESLEHAFSDYGVNTDYPITELAMGVGFFLILTLEHFAHICCAKNQSPVGTTHESVAHNKEVLTNGDSTGVKTPSVSYKKMSNTLYHQPSKDDAILVADFEDSSYADDITYQTYGAVDESLDKTSVRPYTCITGNATQIASEIVFQESDRVLIRNGVIHKDKHSANEYKANTDPSSHGLTRSRLRGLVLLIALSLHMIFDGLALGLLKDDQKVWQLLAALSLHKILVFFTIGVQTLEILGSLKKTLVVLVLFTLVSPCGVIIGESINSTGDSVTRDLLSAILQGIATGTFLFVTFFEILFRELGSDDHDLLKVLCVVTGFVLVASIRLLEHEED